MRIALKSIQNKMEKSECPFLWMTTESVFLAPDSK